MFREYLHVEKYGHLEVDGIELGKTYIFPKIDGTNASVWTNGTTLIDCYGANVEVSNLMAGSRTRELRLDSDNAGFLAWVLGQGYDKLSRFHLVNPKLRLYGEWLVPHTFTGYREDTWRKFYVFDVYNDETEQYLSYDTYKPLLDQFGIDYIPPLAIVKNADYETFLKYVAENKFLCPDGGEPGEGIVIKNYDYYNKFGRQAFAKIIRQEFKDLHHKVMGAPDVNAGTMDEERVLDVALDKHLVEKTYAKIVNDRGGWTSKNIPELLERVYYDIIKEELYDALKETKVQRLNFKTLRAMTIMRIKQMKPEVF